MTLRISKWVVFAVVLGLLPIGLGVIDTITQGDTLHIDGLFRRGELFLVSTAILGAGLAELFTARRQRLPTVRFVAGCAAGLVLVVAALWFADVATKLRDGSHFDGHVVAVGSLVVFGCAFLAGLSCIVVAERAEVELD